MQEAIDKKMEAYQQKVSDTLTVETNIVTMTICLYAASDLVPGIKYNWQYKWNLQAIQPSAN